MTYDENEHAWCVKHLQLPRTATKGEVVEALRLLHDVGLIDGHARFAIMTGKDLHLKDLKMHDHQCPTCKTVWSHSVLSEGNELDHQCPTCKNTEPVWDIFKEEKEQEMQITKAMRDFCSKTYGTAADASDIEVREAIRKGIKDGTLSTKEFVSMGVTVDSILAGSGSSEPGGVPTGNVNLLPATKRYSHVKSAAVHSRTGQKLFDEFGREAMLPSEAEYAKAGAFYKEVGRRSGIAIELTDHERELISECYEKDTWCGQFQNEWRTEIPGSRIKGLLADATSGGVNVTPEWFDADLLTFPLLHSEIFPMVDLVPVPKGNSVESGSVGNPTVTWGVAEGTPIGLFNTDDLIAAINTSIHPVTCALEVGRDFLSDTPAQVGQILMDGIGRRMASELDRVIVLGSGTDEPQGLTVASGTGQPSSENGTSGPASMGDYLSLMFGINKVYRNASMRNVYISNDTTYQRSRNIKVDPADPSTDQRTLFGMNVAKYETLDVPHKIQNDLSNSVALFVALAKYRMYRRQGTTTEFVTSGKQLALSNQVLLVCRGRWGGRLRDPSACAEIDDLQS